MDINGNGRNNFMGAPNASGVPGGNQNNVPRLARPRRASAPARLGVQLPPPMPQAQPGGQAQPALRRRRPARPDHHPALVREGRQGNMRDRVLNGPHGALGRERMLASVDEHRHLLKSIASRISRFRKKDVTRYRDALHARSEVKPSRREEYAKKVDVACDKFLGTCDDARKRLRRATGWEIKQGRTAETLNFRNPPLTPWQDAGGNAGSAAVYLVDNATNVTSTAQASVIPATHGTTVFPALTAAPDTVRKLRDHHALQSTAAKAEKVMLAQRSNYADFLDHVEYCPGQLAERKLTDGFLKFRDAVAAHPKTSCTYVLAEGDPAQQLQANRTRAAVAARPLLAATSNAVNAGFGSVLSPVASALAGTAASAVGVVANAGGGLATVAPILVDLHLQKGLRDSRGAQKVLIKARKEVLRTSGSGGTRTAAAQALNAYYDRALASFLDRDHREAVVEQKFAGMNIAMDSVKLGVTLAGTGMAIAIAAGSTAAAIPVVGPVLLATGTAAAAGLAIHQAQQRHQIAHDKKWDERDLADLSALYADEELEKLVLNDNHPIVSNIMSGDYLGDSKIYAGITNHIVYPDDNIALANFVLARQFVKAIDVPCTDLTAIESSWMMGKVLQYGLDPVTAQAYLSNAVHCLNGGDEHGAMQYLQTMIGTAIGKAPGAPETAHPSAFFRRVSEAFGRNPETFKVVHVGAGRVAAEDATALLKKAGISIPAFLASMALLREAKAHPVMGTKPSDLVDAMLAVADAVQWLQDQMRG